MNLLMCLAEHRIERSYSFRKKITATRATAEIPASNIATLGMVTSDSREWLLVLVAAVRVAAGAGGSRALVNKLLKPTGDSVEASSLSTSLAASGSLIFLDLLAGLALLATNLPKTGAYPENRFV